MEGTRRVLFAGAGHAHLLALSKAAEYVERGLEFTLVAPDRFWYSGMGPGMLSGLYTEQDDTVDVAGMVKRAGGTYVQAHIARIDPDARQVELSDGTRLGYKVLSVNLGSEIALDGIEGASELGVPVKPVRHFAELRAHWSQLPKSPDDPLQVVVIGGGPAGCESAANARRLLRDLGLASRLSLVTHEEHLLERHAPAAHATMLRWLNRAAVEVRLSSKVARLVDGQVELEDGETLKCDVVLVATGVRPSPVVAESGLTTADDGAFVVNEQLQSVSHPEVFGGGDCISLQGRSLDRVGVYAVRQGPVLHKNVLAAATGAPLKGKFRPQKRYLLILNLGDGTGLLLWNRFVRHGRWAFKLKDWLDRRFVTRFQEQIPSGGAPSGGGDAA